MCALVCKCVYVCLFLSERVRVDLCVCVRECVCEIVYACVSWCVCVCGCKIEFLCWILVLFTASQNFRVLV